MARTRHQCPRLTRPPLATRAAGSTWSASRRLNKMNKQAWQSAAVLLLAAASVNSGAAQRKEIRDGLAVEAIISEREVTRIRVENAKITGVVGKIQSASGCASAPEPSAPAAPTAPTQPLQTAAEASITCELSKGEIYLRALGT